jgi:hypothetical protein
MFAFDQNEPSRHISSDQVSTSWQANLTGALSSAGEHLLCKGGSSVRSRYGKLNASVAVNIVSPGNDENCVLRRQAKPSGATQFAFGNSLSAGSF